MFTNSSSDGIQTVYITAKGAYKSRVKGLPLTLNPGVMLYIYIYICIYNIISVHIRLHVYVAIHRHRHVFGGTSTRAY